MMSGSAQLSTRPRPGMTTSNGLEYSLAPAGWATTVRAGTAMNAKARTSTRRASENDDWRTDMAISSGDSLATIGSFSGVWSGTLGAWMDQSSIVEGWGWQL